MTTPRRNIRLTDSQVEALSLLAKGLGSVGERGATLNPVIADIADIATGALAETIAALRIARACAAGSDWHELIETVEPEWPHR
jgi:hypothetical protein